MGGSFSPTEGLEWARSCQRPVICPPSKRQYSRRSPHLIRPSVLSVHSRATGPSLLFAPPSQHSRDYSGFSVWTRGTPTAAHTLCRTWDGGGRTARAQHRLLPAHYKLGALPKHRRVTRSASRYRARAGKCSLRRILSLAGPGHDFREWPARSSEMPTCLIV